LTTPSLGEMASTFAANAYKLQPVLEELFNSQYFYDAAAGVSDDNFGGIVKSPLDLMMGTLQLFTIPLPDPITSAPRFYEKTNGLLKSLYDMGLNLYEPSM